MTKKKKKSYTHFTAEMRGALEKLLRKFRFMKDLALELNVTPAAVHYELNNYSIVNKYKGCNCANRDNCHISGLCQHYCPEKRCRNCDHAAKQCPNYKAPNCRHKTLGGLCNGCLFIKTCHLTKVIYDGHKADVKAKERWKESHSGFRISKTQLDYVNSLVSPLILNKGQSPAYILHNHPEIGLSLSTLYRVIKAGLLDVRPIDLKTLVKLKPQIKYDNSKKKLDPIPPEKRYSEFISWKNSHPGSHWVEMDCVESVSGSSPTLLTFYFTKYKLQIAILIPVQSPACVIQALDALENSIGHATFKNLFPVILTDRGEEFRRYSALEKSTGRGSRTTIFYCNPYSSAEKGHCERNHEFIRTILPHGVDFEGLTQSEVNLMMSHINSYWREAYNLVPIDMFLEEWNFKTLDLFGLKKIHYDEVTLKPKLLDDFYRRTGQTPVSLQDIVNGTAKVDKIMRKY